MVGADPRAGSLNPRNPAASAGLDLVLWPASLAEKQLKAVERDGSIFQCLEVSIPMTIMEAKPLMYLLKMAHPACIGQESHLLKNSHWPRLEPPQAAAACQGRDPAELKCIQACGPPRPHPANQPHPDPWPRGASGSHRQEPTRCRAEGGVTPRPRDTSGSVLSGLPGFGFSPWGGDRCWSLSGCGQRSPSPTPMPSLDPWNP